MPGDRQETVTKVIATYRVQLNPKFRFADLRAQTRYLARLGISTIYTSPILAAKPGSEHGYDVVDPTRLNPELGSDDAFEELLATLEEAGLGLLIDFVPNHMAANSHNPWWTDVLRQGPDSPYADFFDVDWGAEPIRENLSDKVLLPILGQPYGDALEDKEIRIKFERGTFFVSYFERRLPLNFTSYVRIFHRVRESLERQDQTEVAALVGSVLLKLNDWGLREAESISTEEIEQLHHRIQSIAFDQPEFLEAVEHVLGILNGTRGEPESFDSLDTILEEQSYRLSFWRNAAEEINYRRFFDITDLISIRITDPAVFSAAHELILELTERPVVRGLRLDHIDGLYDPIGYLDMLGSHLARRSPDTIVVNEKILGEDEPMPAGFRYRGTTGYEFARDLDRLFIEPEGFRLLDERFTAISRIEGGFDTVSRLSKIRVIRELFRGELADFKRRFAQLTAEDRHAKDLPVSALEGALVQLVASLPVYRTYVRDDSVTDRDRQILSAATEDAAAHLDGDAEIAALRFAQRILTLDTTDETQRQSWRRFAMRFQQFTGPVAAKGIEDTALYVYAPLVSLNEVGAEPKLPDDAVESFHGMNAHRLSLTPETLNASSTHDTKRGEDTRCRIHVLSEMAEEWIGFCERWGKRASGAEPEAPSEAERWFFLQNLAGIWPMGEEDLDNLKERLGGYARKALREAKVHSHWTSIDEDWEAATIDWLHSLISDPSFRREMTALQERVALYGMINSLATVILRTASPGIPDLYQGSELWNLSLVDPDNRRPVNFSTANDMLSTFEERFDSGSVAETLRALREQWDDGGIKLWTTWRALRARHGEPELFLRGEYLPLNAKGPRASHLVTFARRLNDRFAVAVAPRLTSKLGAELPLGEEIWKDTVIGIPNMPTEWRSAMTGSTIETSEDQIAVGEILSHLPVEILIST